MNDLKRDLGTIPDTVSNPVIVGKKHILGIGINEYQNWTHLNNAVKDMESIVQILTTQYDFSSQKTLTNTAATRENIEDELYQLTNSAVLGENDYLLIYYSGHGHLDHNGMGYWVPYNAQKDRISSYLSNSRIRELISVIKCRHILLISDSCFSGSFFADGTRGDAEDLAAEYEKRVSRWAFCSGRHDETVSDGTLGGNSPFASAIIEELQINTRPKLHIARLADKVTEATRSNYPQMPDANPIQNAGHRGGQFVFTLRSYAPTTSGDPVFIPTEPVRAPIIVTPPPPPVKSATPSAELDVIKQDLRNLVGKAKTADAIKKMMVLDIPEMDDDLKMTVLGLSERLETLRKNEMRGTVSSSEAGVERNKIVAGVLSVIGEL
jgi:Caspase domain/Effector-associated domain 11